MIRLFFFSVCIILMMDLSHALELTPEPEQGGMSFGHTQPGVKVSLNKTSIPTTQDGEFILGFHYQHPPQAILKFTFPNGKTQFHKINVKKKSFHIQHINGLPPQMVTPDEQTLKRIKNDAQQVAKARKYQHPKPLYRSGFIWPIQGIITGKYGSQRILNGIKKNPHWGIDIAAPLGTPIKAPADGIVTFSQSDLYYSGATIILEHGLGLSSTFLHLDQIFIQTGDNIKQGQIIGTVGSSGRSTGPHLDWRISLRNIRVNAALLVPPMKK